MNLYLVSQNVNNDWDTYDSFVVVANNEDEARYISPCEYYVWKDGCWNFKYSDGTTNTTRHQSWCNPKDVSVKLIGVADSSLEHGEVVCASYNAG